MAFLQAGGDGEDPAGLGDVLAEEDDGLVALQLLVQRFERALFVDAGILPDSSRGAGGYGSTGTGSSQ